MIDEFENKNINECNNKQFNFKSTLQAPYIGRPSMEYKKKMEKLLIEQIEDFKIGFTTTKTGIYFNNKDETPHKFNLQVHML